MSWHGIIIEASTRDRIFSLKGFLFHETHPLFHETFHETTYTFHEILLFFL